ncbi:MAG: HPF/RaiA family ribosome-associated protein [Bdellovibrionota bacterium]
MDIQFRYQQIAPSSPLESFTHQILSETLIHFKKIANNIVVSFEYGPFGRRVKISIKNSDGYSQTATAYADTMHDAVTAAINKLKEKIAQKSKSTDLCDEEEECLSSHYYPSHSQSEWS